MKNNGRIINSIKNTTNGLLAQIISVILSFVVRTFFVKCLGESYLGINGVFSNILTILSLTELGFGATIIYCMYKPLAENDEEKLNALMKLYKKVYIIIGVIVAIIGCSLIPFLDLLLKGKENINNIILIYLMFLTDSVSSYFFAYKRSILSADQKEYICSQYRYIFILVKSIFQIIILVIFKNFILYLLIQILSTISENIFISLKVNKLYPFLKKNSIYKLSEIELKSIKEDVKALFLTKIGHVMLNGTDNIIISTYIGVKWAGLLSNYTMITGAIVMVLSQLTSGITGSVGNYVTKESNDDKYALFRLIDFINFSIYNFCSILLIVLINPFIELWIGNKFLLNENICIVIGINFLINGIISSWWIFRSTMGLFTQGKYRPIFTAILNIEISIILASKLGILGVLLGTTISRAVVNLWYDPYIIYKYGFKRSCLSFYKVYLKRILVFILTLFTVNFLKQIITMVGITYGNFIFLMIISIIVSSIIYLIFNFNDKEFKQLKIFCKNSINMLKVNKKLV